MNIQTGKLTGVQEIDVRITNFYRLRSEVLDCFADIEKTILNYISRSGQKNCCMTLSLGHKLEAAKKVPAGPQRSKDLKNKADAELNKLTNLLPARADMVHSRMEIAITTSSEVIAIFKNSKDAGSDCQEALVFKMSQLENFVSKLGALEKSLKKALNAQNAPVVQGTKQTTTAAKAIPIKQ